MIARQSDITGKVYLEVSSCFKQQSVKVTIIKFTLIMILTLLIPALGGVKFLVSEKLCARAFGQH